MYDPNANPFATRSTSDGPVEARRSGIHAFAQAALIRAVDPNLGADGGWWMLTEADVVVDSQTTFRADVAGWRRSRLPGVPFGEIDVLPDWVCEILTPGHVAQDRVVTMAAYANHGISAVWLVDPVERTLEAYELDGGSWRYLGAWTDGGPVAVPPFVEQEIDVGQLFLPQEDSPSHQPVAASPPPVTTSEYTPPEPVSESSTGRTELPPL
ncbi:MAG: Uma2 family endonuclease [Myxococcales bacterium]|nr:Uma2 family endonuclease [Myxococcales bacterium]